jgi:hypothetical protein
VQKTEPFCTGEPQVVQKWDAAGASAKASRRVPQEMQNA